MKNIPVSTPFNIYIYFTKFLVIIGGALLDLVPCANIYMFFLVVLFLF